MSSDERGDLSRRHLERRAKPARRSIAFYSPRPPLLRGSTKEILVSKTKPSDGGHAAEQRVHSRCFLRSQPRRRLGLGYSLGRDPSRTSSN